MIIAQQGSLDGDLPAPHEGSQTRRSSAPPMLQRSRSSPMLLLDGSRDPPGIVSHVPDLRTPKRVRFLQRKVNGVRSRCRALTNPTT